MEKNNCNYCGSPTTQAAFDYCKRLGFPIACYQCQYDKGINVYSIQNRGQQKGGKDDTNRGDE